jgi:hypothetical protein
VTALLALIPKPVLAVALLLCGIFAGQQTLKLGAERTAHAHTKTAFAEAARAQAEDQARTVSAYRKQEYAWQTAMEGLRHDTRKQLQAVEIDSATAAAAGDRLRVRLSQLAACHGGATQAAPAADRGASAPSAAGMLADVQRRLDQAATTVARFADASRIAGQACERAYDTLSTGATP